MKTDRGEVRIVEQCHELAEAAAHQLLILISSNYQWEQRRTQTDEGTYIQSKVQHLQTYMDKSMES